MRTRVGNFWVDQAGMTTVEYAVLLCGLVLGATTMIWLGLTGHMAAAVASAETSFDEAQGW